MNDLFGAVAPFWSWLMGGVPRTTAPRQVIVVAGGTANVGTSFVTTLLGTAAAVAGHSVLVVDGEAGALPARVRQVAPRFSAYGLVLIDAGSRIGTIREVCGVLGDMPRNGDRVLAVTSADATAIAAAYALTKNLLARSPRLDIQLLVNGSDVASAAAVGEHVRAGVRLFLRRSVGFAGHIPDDPALGMAHHAGAGLPEALAVASAAPAVLELLGRLVRPPRAMIDTSTPPAAPLPAPLPLEA